MRRTARDAAARAAARPRRHRALPGRLLAALLALVATAQGAVAEVGLAHYRVAIAGQPVEGVSRNLSGLTYSAASGTLLATVNRPAAIAELSLQGRLLRLIPLPAAWDAEGIAHVAGNRFVVADEAGNLLHWLRIEGGAAIPERSIRLRLGWRALPNLGFEGVGWDRERAELLLVNEKWPRKVLLVSGLGPGTTGPATLREWWPARQAEAIGRDLAAIEAGPGGTLLLLSEQSARITEYGREGALLGLLELRAGHAGLHRDVPQPEGMALGPDGAILVVSEPNLFYRFTRGGGEAEGPRQVTPPRTR